MFLKYFLKMFSSIITLLVQKSQGVLVLQAIIWFITILKIK